MQPKRVRQPPDVRRAAILDATVACLVDHGATGASTRVIAARAAVAPALLAYHFGTKERLLEATYRHLAAQLAQAGRDAVAAAGDDPRARLRAFLATGFRPPFLDAQQLTARVVLWSIAATEPALHAVHVELYDRYRRELSQLISPLTPNGKVDPRLVFAVSALLDGLWLERSAGQREYDTDAMIDTCMRLIDAALA
jgi:TetR/AcrR family transcriptional regulator, transcriptional repressor of bet genes